ncbi:hypothetical protein MHBO_001714 [Bonamia ostreae]|uniref:ABC transporter domain-containing protein n=1 Tax=Bonamia ostreae TaxID=126728 RepID=A0ABV2AK27_9EUKA
MYHKKLSYYKGDYKSFEKVYKENLMNQIKAFEAQQKQIKHIQEFIDKFRYNAKRASMVQSRIKMLRNMEKKEEVSKDKKFKMVFPAVEPLSKEIVSLTNVYFGYNKNDILLKDVDFVIQCNSRIGLMGANGVGKSTLLKLIMGFYQPLKGKVEINENAKISFFTQHHVDSLDLEKSALENITKQFEDEIPEQIDNKAEYCRKRLGRFGISQDLATRPLRHLSGGQVIKINFLKIF